MERTVDVKMNLSSGGNARTTLLETAAAAREAAAAVDRANRALGEQPQPRVAAPTRLGRVEAEALARPAAPTRLGAAESPTARPTMLARVDGSDPAAPPGRTRATVLAPPAGTRPAQSCPCPPPSGSGGRATMLAPTANPANPTTPASGAQAGFPVNAVAGAVRGLEALTQSLRQNAAAAEKAAEAERRRGELLGLTVQVLIDVAAKEAERNKGLQVGTGEGEKSHKKGGAAGLLGNLGGAIDAVGGALGTVGQISRVLAGTLEGVARVVNTLNNSYLTQKERGQALLDSIPIIGRLFSAARGAIEAFAGMPEALRRYREQSMVELALIRTQGAQRSQLSALGAQRDTLAARARALRRAPLVPTQVNRPLFGLGLVEAEETQRLIPARIAQRSARAEASGAREASSLARMRREAAEINAGNFGRERVQAEQRLGQIRGIQAGGMPMLPGGMPMPLGGMVQAVAAAINPAAPGGNQRRLAEGDALAAIERERAALNQLRAAREQEGNAARESAQAEARFRQANLALAREELSILEQRERTAREGAGRLGGMNRVERQMNVSALRIVREAGIENVSREVAAMAAQIAPQTVAAMRQRAGMNAPEVQELRQLAPQDYRDTGQLQQIAARVDQARAQVNLSVQLDERALAESLSGLIGPFIREIRRTFTDEMRAAAAAARLAAQIRNAQG